ncbi:MAG TPA: hypothetical protein VGN17_14690 [Bryobacteraceae bacterium]|jgi:hypothetical protein
MMIGERSLDQERREFAARSLLAMPIAGAIMWAVVGVVGVFLPSRAAAMVLFLATGMIAYLGMFLSKFTGENFLDRSRPKNALDTLFFFTVGQSVLTYAIAIPFYLVDHTSLPLTVGILSGTMWLPMSWIIDHWVGLFHGITRTALVVAAWYVFPAHRFVVIPAIIVAIYLVTIAVLVRRERPPAG